MPIIRKKASWFNKITQYFLIRFLFIYYTINDKLNLESNLINYMQSASPTDWTNIHCVQRIDTTATIVALNNQYATLQIGQLFSLLQYERNSIIFFLSILSLTLKFIRSTHFEFQDLDKLGLKLILTHASNNADYELFTHIIAPLSNK